MEERWFTTGSLVKSRPVYSIDRCLICILFTHICGGGLSFTFPSCKQQQRILLYKFIDTKDWLYAVCVVHPLLNWPMNKHINTLLPRCSFKQCNIQNKYLHNIVFVLIVFSICTYCSAGLGIWRLNSCWRIDHNHSRVHALAQQWVEEKYK